jgi:salicylate hydroxylase
MCDYYGDSHVLWQVYERNMRMSGGEGALITLFPNGCQVLNMADPQIMAKVEFLS